MRYHIAIVVMFFAGCGADSDQTESAPPAIVYEASGHCFWKKEASEVLGCLPDTPVGCVCGPRGADGYPAGGCGNGSCCTGCWDPDAQACRPGDGSDGPHWGSHGAWCRAAPWSWPDGA